LFFWLVWSGNADTKLRRSSAARSSSSAALSGRPARSSTARYMPAAFSCKVTVDPKSAKPAAGGVETLLIAVHVQYDALLVFEDILDGQRSKEFRAVVSSTSCTSCTYQIRATLASKVNSIITMRTTNELSSLCALCDVPIEHQ